MSEADEIRRWRRYREELWTYLAEKHHLPTPGVKAKRILDNLEASLREILADGLDVGGIVRHVVPVTLEEHPKHGWVFVCANGEMHLVSMLLPRHKRKGKR